MLTKAREDGLVELFAHVCSWVEPPQWLDAGGSLISISGEEKLTEASGISDFRPHTIPQEGCLQSSGDSLLKGASSIPGSVDQEW